MTTRTVEQVEQWESRAFSDGYRGLHDLADADFSGIVTAGPTRLCMTKGTVVGILDGSIEDFEGASGTAKEAPTPALPLLAVMQERNDEVRAQYYTEETPLSEVDRTLTDGNFTGYVVLSENVLSGDYYQVYHQGRSMSVAYVGASDQLLTDEEAFEQANDEVGIYEVRPAEIEVVEIPEPEPDEQAQAAAGGPAADTDDDTESAETADSETEPDEATEAESPEATEGHNETADGTEEAESDSAAESQTEDSSAEPAEPSETEGATDAESTSDPSPDSGETREDSSTRSDAEAEPRANGTRESTPSQSSESTGSSAGESTNTRSPANEQSRSDRETTDRTRSGETQERAQTGSAPQGSTAAGRSRGQSQAGSPQPTPTPQASSSENVADLETRSIPSLDPGRTETPGGGSTATAGADRQARPRSGNDRPAAGTNPQPTPEPNRQSAGQSTAGARTQDPPAERQPQQRQENANAASGGQANQEPESESEDADLTAEVEELESELDEREDEIERLESELEDAEQAREELEAERDELEERVEKLERRIDELRTEEGGESIADRERLSPGEAIEGTNLFIRYGSKGDATLEAAHDGRAEAGAVNDNLEIQHHTQFEAEDVAVNGEPFDAFLTETLQYKFVEWVVRVLPYEIRDTGHAEALADLYEALPKIDRAELNGSIAVRYQEEGQETRSQERFDIVLRDRMGNPLLVTNLSESRQPASQSEMETVITSGQRVGEAKETLSGAFLVTSSFFEPEAMEAADDATGSGLLSRDKRESFVKLTRKDGFHLCLVEARDEQFNLAVPEI